MSRVTLESHAPRYSRTNAHGVVAVCACGWIGNVHRAARAITKSGKGGRRLWEHAEQRAEAEHREHKRTATPLYGVPTPENFVGVVLNTKRFGHA